ncbi:MAG: N-acetylmuramoyl-L-alanine amidase [Rubellimicrobium sp.]|nr:N-acetylmuramoyl-L-alanine amidase [Rubellimicrobium sp.]
MVVLHYTAMPDARAAAARLCDPAAEVSCHYLVDTDGSVLGLVSEDLRAWHAGAGRWGAVTDVNSHSIGIELQNSGHEPFADAQMGALRRLLAGVMTRHAIRPERVIGHSDMAPLRKSDPGPLFDWQALARAGLSVWPGGAGPARPVAGFRAAATAFGYDPDLPLDAVLRAFRLRFRPGVCGPVAAEDAALMGELAHRWPVDRGVAAP